MPEVVALGDINVDIIAQFDRYPAKGEDALASATEIHCGGSAANAAMTLARIGIKTSLISRVGPDSWALKALTCLNEAGVEPGGLQRDPGAMTGMMYVVVTPDGDRTILGHRGANVFTDPNQIREEDIQAAKVFLLSGYSLLADPQRSAALLALEIACRHGLTVALDPGLTVSQSALDEMKALLPVVDILLPNLSEAQHMTGKVNPKDCTEALLDSGVEVVALKMSREGCLVATADEFFRLPAFPVETRDSTGAGDCFAAGLIAGFLGHLGWHGAALLGSALGAMSVAHVGAATAVPKAREVLSLLRDHRYQVSDESRLEVIRQVTEYVTTLATVPEEEGKPWWK
jgi:sugar/nucleoside kinase (ribokinase family)